jgi:hypothetical protein
MHRRLVLLTLLASLSIAAPARAQPYLALAADTPILRYELGPEETDRQLFGSAVALSEDGTRAIVGVPEYTVGPVPSGTPLGGGRFRIFVRTGTTWASERELTSGVADEALGTSVAMSGDGSVVLIGGPGASSAAGRARVMRRSGSTWTLEGPLVPSGVAANDRAGSAVALSADGAWAVVGVPYDDTARGTNAGRVAVFVHGASGWTEDASLVPTTGNDSSFFGASVAISSVSPLRIVVGAPGDRLTGAQGAVYVFQRVGSGWVELGRLFDEAGGALDALGSSVAIDGAGTRIVAGAPLAPVDGIGLDGKVLHFALVGSEWRHLETLSAPTASEELGTSVSLSSDGRRLIVGAPRFSTTAGDQTGTARLYLRRGTSFAVDASARPSDAAHNDEVGRAVALAPDGTRAIVGVPRDEGGAPDEGSARVFRITTNNGAACGAATECASGFCADGVCCNAACVRGAGTACQACLSASTGVADGTCAPITAGTTCAPGTGTCDPPDVCDGVSVACPATLAPSSTVCRAAAGACDAAETCTGTSGACPADGRAADGTSCADATVCNGAETCLGGACSGAVALDCDDGDACTADACDAIIGCAHEAVPLCCRSDAECLDATVCNGAESCVASSCVAGSPLDCDDGDACTADACDAISGCAHEAVVGCCNVDLDCDDGEPCTDDTCTGPGGACEHAPRCDAGGGLDASVLVDGGSTPDGGARDADVVDAAALDGGAGDAPGSDAGGPPAMDAGCSCRVGASPAMPSSALAGLAILTLILRRRRR